MPVYSMTGYASAQQGMSEPATGTDAKTPAGRPGLEIRSVNGRFLDLSFRLPEELRGHEPAMRELLVSRLKRGKIEVRVFIEKAGADTIVDPSPRLMQRLGSLQDSIQAWLPGAPALSVAEILKLAASEQGGSHDWGPTLLALTTRAINDLLAARQREGERLATMLHERIGQLRQLARQAGPLLPQLVEQQRLRFLERWQEAMALTEGVTPPQAAQERALTEATAYAIRIDVAEELTRLDSHLDEIERLLNKGGELGKRLDFLIQELHREANTLGSKSAMLELTRISVDMKVLIEQMREQVQNLE